MIQYLAVTRALKTMQGHRQYINPSGRRLWRRAGVSPPTDVGTPPKPPRKDMKVYRF